MAGKGKKKKDTGANKEKKKGGKKKAGRTSGSGKSSKIQGDIFSDGAIENAYLLCHNVQVCFVNTMHPKRQCFHSFSYFCSLSLAGCIESARIPVARRQNQGQEEAKVEMYDAITSAFKNNEYLI